MRQGDVPPEAWRRLGVGLALSTQRFVRVVVDERPWSGGLGLDLDLIGLAWGPWCFGATLGGGLVRRGENVAWIDVLGESAPC